MLALTRAIRQGKAHFAKAIPFARDFHDIGPITVNPFRYAYTVKSTDFG